MSSIAPVPATLSQRLLRRLLFARLQRVQHGCLTVIDEWCGEQRRFGVPDPSLDATVRVLAPSFHEDVVLRGTVGAGEAWVAGAWTSDDPIAVVRLMVRNRGALDSMERGLARLSAPLLRAFHALRRNTRRGSRRNIAAHYDLGNDFFELLLDPTMTYSSALFARPGMSLEEASVAKLDRLCNKLDLRSSDHVLEIGTGWGSFAIHAAERYGCRVTTTTISRQQAELARARVRARGLADRVDVLERDYRDLDGTYDKLVSIEMVEAVGHQYLGRYLAKCCSLLRPDGSMALQAITIQDQHYRRALREVDFVKRHVFPGSFIPSVTAIAEAMTADTDFRIAHLEDLAPHYAETLRRWRQNLHARTGELEQRGYGEPFRRLFDWYLCYCAGGFDERALGVAQILLHRPLHRGASVLPQFPAETAPVAARRTA